MTAASVDFDGLERETNLRRAISLLLFVNVALHIVAFVLSGATEMGLLIGAAVYAFGGFAIPRRWPVVALLVFLFMMFGMWVSLAAVLSGTGLYAIAMGAILALDIVIWIMLFLLFWRR